MNSAIIYLDHAAATPVDERVLADMTPYFTDKFYNPSSPYIPAVDVRRDYENAKSRIGVCIGAKGDEIVMTAGATESINLAFNSCKGHIVTTAIEHNSVIEAAKRRDATFVDVDAKGRVSTDDIRQAIRHDTELVSVALANHELGTIQALRDIAEIVRNERHRRAESGEQAPIYLHSDASQGVGQIDINVARLGVDMLTLNAAKIYGPKQVGLLWVSSAVRLEPVIVGGGQERNLRSGTENVAGVVGFARALELATEHRHSESKRLAVLRDKLQEALENEFPDMVVSGSPKHRLPGHLHVALPGVDAERLVFGLEARGVLAATGSACAANKGTRSHVLTAIGLEDKVADGSLRLTLGRLSNDDNTNEAARLIIEVVRSEYERTKR